MAKQVSERPAMLDRRRQEPVDLILGPHRRVGIAHSYCWRAFTEMSVRPATQRRTNHDTVPRSVERLSARTDRAAANAEHDGEKVPMWWRRWDSNPRPPACKAGALAS